MKSYEYIHKELHHCMRENNMNAGLRNLGRLAGGLNASKSVSNTELYQLAEFVTSLANDKDGVRSKWKEAVDYGRRQPVPWNPTQFNIQHKGVVYDLNEEEGQDNDSEIIEGLLRKGHKLLLSGPSEAEPSIRLIQLNVAVATGGYWLGWKVQKGNVLCVNLYPVDEEKQDEFRSRDFLINEENLGFQDFWQFFGISRSMSKMESKISRMVQERNYSMIIVDTNSEYWINKENSAEEITAFCNLFDRIAAKFGVSVAHTYSNSKSSNVEKPKRDCFSGYRGFDRDPDVIIDMIELVIDDALRKKFVQRMRTRALKNELNRIGSNWHENFPQDDCQQCEKLTRFIRENKLNIKFEEVDRITSLAEISTGWRLDVTPKEIPELKSQEFFFAGFNYMSDFSEDPLLRGVPPKPAEKSFVIPTKQNTSNNFASV